MHVLVSESKELGVYVLLLERSIEIYAPQRFGKLPNVRAHLAIP